LFALSVTLAMCRDGKILEKINKSLGCLRIDDYDDLLITVEPVACLGACGMARSL
jgi:NADH:ubiquinone oxidoreductase subunit E